MEEASNLVQEPAHHDPYYGFCERHAMNPGHLVNLTNASTGASCVCVFVCTEQLAKCGAESLEERERRGRQGAQPSAHHMCTCAGKGQEGRGQPGGQPRGRAYSIVPHHPLNRCDRGVAQLYVRGSHGALGKSGFVRHAAQEALCSSAPNATTPHTRLPPTTQASTTPPSPSPLPRTGQTAHHGSHGNQRTRSRD